MSRTSVGDRLNSLSRWMLNSPQDRHQQEEKQKNTRERKKFRECGRIVSFPRAAIEMEQIVSALLLHVLRSAAVIYHICIRPETFVV